MGVFFIRLLEKVNEQCCWDILLSQEILDATKCLIDDNSVFQQDSALVWSKTLNFLSPELWPLNSRELNPIDYKI